MARGSERPLLLAGRPLYAENNHLLRDMQVRIVRSVVALGRWS
jgi:hypothetical protein